MVAAALRAGGGVTHGWKAMKAIADTDANADADTN